MFGSVIRNSIYGWNGLRLGMVRVGIIRSRNIFGRNNIYSYGRNSCMIIWNRISNCGINNIRL